MVMKLRAGVVVTGRGLRCGSRRAGWWGVAGGTGHTFKSQYLTCAHELSITLSLSTEAGESEKLGPHYYSNSCSPVINLWGEECAKRRPWSSGSQPDEAKVE